MRIGPSLSITGVNSVTPEAIVRSLSPAAWFRPGVGVTGALTVSNWADQSGNARDLAQATAGNQPINLPHTGTDYAYLPAVLGNHFTTPNAAANQILGSIDVRCKCALDDWTPATYQFLASKDDGSSARGWNFAVNTGSAGTLAFSYTNDGGTLRTASSSVATGLADGATKWVRATYNSATGKVNFYLSDDGESWTVLGSEQPVTSGAIYNANTNVIVGGNPFSSSTYGTNLKLYRAQIYNGIDGTLAVDFDPSRFIETSTNGATATMSTGEVWTLNSTGAYPATIVKSSQILFGGVDEWMEAAFTIGKPATFYIVGKQVSWTNNDYWLDGVTQNAYVIYQNTSTPNLAIYTGITLANATTLAVGSFGALTAVFNGANSVFQINAATPAEGSTGINNDGGGIVLAARGSDHAVNANIIVKEVLIFSAAHTAAQRATMIQTLNSMHRCY